jgi:2-polyprenyl-3-methyl-5-hydroxy-6-metoxy-1,4-benzoquinol methylase
VALHVCRMNKERNRVAAVELENADWEHFQTNKQFDLILGADVLYATSMHTRLRSICEQYLAPNGRVLFADPLRADSLKLLGAMEASGWQVSLAKWTIQVETGPRTIAIYELTYPSDAERTRSRDRA